MLLDRHDLCFHVQAVNRTQRGVPRGDSEGGFRDGLKFEDADGTGHGVGIPWRLHDAVEERVVVDRVEGFGEIHVLPSPLSAVQR